MKAYRVKHGFVGVCDCVLVLNEAQARRRKPFLQLVEKGVEGEPSTYRLLGKTLFKEGEVFGTDYTFSRLQLEMLQVVAGEDAEPAAPAAPEVEAAETETPTDPNAPSEEWSVEELKAYATTHGVDVSKARTKKQVLAALKAEVGE